MLDNDILKKIEDGKIKSRRQLYREVGRSKKLLKWLNQHDILVPVRWDKGKVKAALLKIRKEKGRLPKSSDSWKITCAAQNSYGSWNDAMKDAFGAVNQHRYTCLSNEDLLKLVRNHIVKYNRIPSRQEFDGKSDDYPYWEVYLERFGLKRWSDVFSLIDMDKLSIFYDTKHGYGNIRVLDGITYLSHQEYLIGKYLTDNNISFEKEVPYDNCDYVFDFYLPEHDLYVEYYGIHTDDYRMRIEEKRQKYAGRNVFEIFKHDNTIKKLASKVQRL